LPPDVLGFTVVGSINLDLVARCERLPRPGETLTGASFERIPGGKGANQAVALARLGAQVTFVGCVGDDPFAAEALAGLTEAGVDLGRVRKVAEATGVALILVDSSGENQIVVAPGANRLVRAEDATVPAGDAVLTQLEVPTEAIRAAFASASGLRCLNAAPALAVPQEVLADADLVVVNRLELEALESEPQACLAVTLGAEGAILYRGGKEIARARPPVVTAVDGTAAGDAFCACLAYSLVEGRPDDEALRRACAAGAISASRAGAQPSLPTRGEIDAVLRG
jgi:ribokinase